MGRNPPIPVCLICGQRHGPWCVCLPEMDAAPSRVERQPANGVYRGRARVRRVAQGVGATLLRRSNGRVQLVLGRKARRGG